MQTFLPYPSFVQSAQALDRQRLGKQRVEARQILDACGRREGGWVRHPAVCMWRGFEPALALYGIAVCLEWLGRGYCDSQLALFLRALTGHSVVTLPTWLGSERLHASHRSNLLRKNAAWYGRFGWHEPPTLDYWWPVERS